MYLLQYIDTRKPLGECIRVLDGSWTNRPEPDEVQRVANRRGRFMVFLNLSRNMRRGEITYVGNARLPDLSDEDRWRYPAHREHGFVMTWWVRDANRKRVVSSLSAADRRRSVSSLVSIALLRRALRSGWTPENDRGVPFYGPLEPLPRGQESDLGPFVRVEHDFLVVRVEHDFLAPTIDIAEAFARALTREGRSTAVDEASDGYIVSVFESFAGPEDVEPSEALCRRAASLGMRYEGSRVGR